MLLKKVRPAGGANEWLWGFNDLSNLDKHNLNIPAVTVARVIGSFRIGTNTFTDCGGGGDPSNMSKRLRRNSPD
jgi:hypothetical protein